MPEEHGHFLIPEYRVFSDILVQDELLAKDFVIVLLLEIVGLQFGKGGSFAGFGNAWVGVTFGVFKVVVVRVTGFHLLLGGFGQLDDLGLVKVKFVQDIGLDPKRGIQNACHQHEQPHCD